MASTASPGPHLGTSAGASGGAATASASNGGMEELLPLVMQLMNADQVSLHKLFFKSVKAIDA